MCRGGKLKKFMVYDLIVFLLTLAVFFLIQYVGEAKEDWQIRHTFYFCKIMYGLLSFPFLIFALPPMELLLTRSRGTAYNK